MNFEPGQLVTLKSGGPPLTVIAMDGGNVRCVWFAHADDRLQEATIPAVCLDVLNDEDEGDTGFDDDARAPALPPIRGR